MIDYLEIVYAMARKLKKQDKTPEDAIVEDLPEPFRNWQFTNFFQANIRIYV
jgi:hypothetical protein